MALGVTRSRRMPLNPDSNATEAAGSFYDHIRADRPRLAVPRPYSFAPHDAAERSLLEHGSRRPLDPVGM